MSKTICIDLDGTIIHYEEWVNEEHFPELVPNVSLVLNELKEKGWLIIIYTTRSNKELISNFLSSKKVPFDYINENPNQPLNAIGGKPIADIYVDDRAINFNGDWLEILKKIEAFKTWEDKKIMEKNNDNTDFEKDFLLSDFNQSYQQLRHYDVLNWDITKFSFLQLLLSVGAIWAIYNFAQKNSDSFIVQYQPFLIATICLISYLFSLLVSFLLVRNRIYYTKVARYLNEHRELALRNNPSGFNNYTKFYVDYGKPKVFEKYSTQSVFLYIIQFLSSLLLGFGLYLFLSKVSTKFFLILISIVFMCLLFGGILYFFIRYMKNYEKNNF